MSDVTKLLPVGVQAHGADKYLVSRDEYTAREQQVYGIVGLYDEAREKALVDRETIIKLQRRIEALEKADAKLRADILRLVDQ